MELRTLRYFLTTAREGNITRAADILHMTQREFAGRRDAVSGVISLGVSEAMGGLLLARYMKEFSRQYPLVKFDLYNEMADNIREKIAKGLVDIGLVLEPVDTTNYDFLRLNAKETWGVLCHRNDPLSEKDHVAARELWNRPLFLPKRPNARSVLIWKKSHLFNPATSLFLQMIHRMRNEPVEM